MNGTEDNIKIPPTIKNEHYTNMLKHLDSAIKNWKSFSRLDRLEYAYKCLELARNYTCSTRGVDPSLITPSLEILNNAGQSPTAKYPNGNIQSVVTLSVRDVLNAFKSSPERILTSALHECTHACDAHFMERPYCENLPNMGQIKVGDIIYPQGMNRELNESYKTFGIAWNGDPKEIRAEKVGYGVTTDLLKDLTALYPENTSYQTRCNAFSSKAVHQLNQQYEAAIQLEQWKSELMEKYAPEGQSDFPKVTEDMISTDYQIPKHSFVDIQTIRNVAEENPEIFKLERYVSSELNGATNKQEVDEQGPEVVKIFSENNDMCAELISQEIIPQTVVDFYPMVEIMELN